MVDENAHKSVLPGSLNIGSDSSMVDENQNQNSKVPLHRLCSDSSMVDENETPIAYTTRAEGVQIPLWSMKTCIECFFNFQPTMFRFLYGRWKRCWSK